MRENSRLRLVPVLVAMLLAGGCESGGKRDGTTRPVETGGASGDSLYVRLGGEPAIAAVVDDFVARAAGNPKVNFTRKGTAREWSATPENVEHLKKMLVHFIGMATGGPQKYEGRDMQTAHAGMQISSDEFNALAADLTASLDALKTPEAEKDELLAIVAATAKDIVSP